MKKKILLIIVASFMIMGAVSAASLWGKYKGKEVIRLMVAGVPVTVSDAPAVLMDDRTMIPIYLLKQAGINYNWDPTTRTVDIAPIPSQGQAQQAPSGFNISDISKEVKKVNVEFVEYVSDGNGFNSMAFHYNDTFETLFDESNRLDTIFDAGLKTDATFIKVVDKDGSSMGATEETLIDFYSGKITPEQFINNSKLDGPYFNNNSNSGLSNTPVPSIYPELFSNDGKTYLGKLTSNEYDSDSVFNTYGTYGNEYQTNSIWNSYGIYGSDYSDTSAFNKYASKPPVILLDGKIIGYLTVNTTKTNAVSPITLLNWLTTNGY